ncbi:periodic tryptophan protein 2 homolog [Ctenocephalides felis]|uniref:periodic tryptophan protein 2 homolog n=1 Tax=Ctenocephalides felis TaxID=7515 RepID=UPI000E6E257C|nr:periodic tryptophan protein 2 homolog [Ctenocephalides felis]
MNNQEKITEFVEDETVQERDDQGKIILKTDDQKHSFFYRRHSRHYLADEVRKEDKNAVLTAATYHKKTKILVTGFSNGSFFLHEMPEVNMIHSLSISQQNITALSINNTGDWIALGCSGVGQLLVWEWQCEQYVMKQQGHSSNMTCLSYSPDSEFIVTGGLDGKLKLWNTSTGFCVITFSEHTSAITQVQFSKKCFISSSLDGTVRAFDMTRYRNFRTFTSPSRPVQFSCVAVDSSGELVCAGGQDIFELYLWSMKMGRLLEVLSGHEGPVVSISFSPSPGSSCLVSCSWDGTIRVWDALESSAQNEPIILGSDALCVTFRPDGEEIAVATLDGQITMFHVKSGSQTHSIEGRNDLGSGRTETDLVTAKQSLKGKAFTSLCYSADGECILAGGQSKNVCIYNVQEGILLKKFQITQNRSFDAVDDFINRRKMTEFGNIALIEEREISEGGNVTIKLPGVKSGDMASRTVKPEVRVLCLQFSPAGHSWAACTTEGLLLYSLDNAFVFDPFLLDLGTTPEAARNCLKEQQYSMALIMALRLNELALIHEIIEQIPYADIEITANSLPQEYAKRALKFISKTLEGTTHIQFYLRWTTAFLEMLGPRDRGTILPETLVALEKSLLRKYDALSKICDFNKYTLQWVKKMGELEEAKQTQVINDDDSNEDEMDYSDHDDSETEITDLLSVKL